MGVIYQSQRMRLECVSTVLIGAVNDVLVCRDLKAAADTLYTLLVVKDHTTARKCLEVFSAADKDMDQACLHSFSDKGALCLVFSYGQARPLSDFYAGKYFTLPECEKICENIVVTCMTSALPFPLLYLALKQGQLNLGKDHGVNMGYFLDLKELNGETGERECAVECAQTIKNLLSSKESDKAFSFRLVEKKVNRQSYTSFVELYKDIQVASAPQKKPKLRVRARKWVNRRLDGFFKFLLFVCVVLAVFALASLISQLFFGGVPWLRFFQKTFSTIGTESLTQ